MYYEPHCDYGEQSLEDANIESVDVVITPASTQLLLGYPLVCMPKKNRKENPSENKNQKDSASSDT